MVIPLLSWSEQPGEELRGEQRKAAAKHDAADLPLGAPLAKHEHEAAEDDRDEGEGAGEGPGEGSLEVPGGTFPRRLCGGGEGPSDQDDGGGRPGGEGERMRSLREGWGHGVPPCAGVPVRARWRETRGCRAG